MGTESPRRKILERIRAEAPAGPGVYIFRDASSAILYVGKSVNVRRRAASYFQRKGAAFETRIRLMRDSVRDCEFRETGSEFLALLLEDRLIKEHLPPYNVRQKRIPDCRYLLLTGDAWPTLLVVDSTEPLAAGRVFGPYRNRFTAERIRGLVHRSFRLRACREREPAAQCIHLGIGICPGPCCGKAPRDEYAAIVERVIAFLEGDASGAVAVLAGAMETAAAALDFERAAALREEIVFCERFCARQRFFHRFRTGTVVVSDRIGAEELTHVFERGVRSTRTGRSPLDGAADGVADGAVDSAVDGAVDGAADDRYLLDRAEIVFRQRAGPAIRSMSVRQVSLDRRSRKHVLSRGQSIR